MRSRREAIYPDARRFCEYFSEVLATHVRKGRDSGHERIGIPWRHAVRPQAWWSGKDGQRVLQCDPEHPGGVHQIEDQGRAVVDLFERYARGNQAFITEGSGVSVRAG